MARSPVAISDILNSIETRVPVGCAEEWDNVGLLVGDPKWKTTGAVVSIDLTEEALDTARSKGFRLILNHHPCLFPKGRGADRLVPGQGRAMNTLVFEAIRSGIAVAAYHTNFDRCALEVVEALSAKLGVTPKGRLIDKPQGSLTKLSVFVPTSHAETVRAAICDAGAGVIGHYDHCTFATIGRGTFRGGKSAKPFLGKPGKLEYAEEVRLETVFPRGLEKAVLGALRASHPYEEIAYDLYALEQGPSGEGLVRGLGYGFWGDFKKAHTLSEALRKIRSAFGTRRELVTQSVRSKKIRRVAFSPGKGDFANAARFAGCDLYVTGEVGYHDAAESARHGLTTVQLGHTQSERYYLETMTTWSRELGLACATLRNHAQTL